MERIDHCFVLCRKIELMQPAQRLHFPEVLIIHILPHGIRQAVRQQQRCPAFGLSQQIGQQPTFFQRRCALRGQIAVYLHKTKGDQTAEPAIGGLLDHIGITLLFDSLQQLSELTVSCFRQGVRIWGNSQFTGFFRHRLQKLLPYPEGKVFHGCFIHDQCPFSGNFAAVALQLIIYYTLPKIKMQQKIRRLHHDPQALMPSLKTKATVSEETVAFL